MLAISSCSGSMVFSPDGKEVAVAAPEGLYVVSSDGNQVRQLIVPPGYSPAGDVTWSPRGEYIAYVYSDNGTIKVGVTRSHGTSAQDLWIINPDGMTDWPRWTTDQRLLVTSGSSQPLDQVYVVWMSQPPVIELAERCHLYEMAASTSRQQYAPWGPGRSWMGGSSRTYAADN
jgi:Tol biopolymer transport system component